MSIHIIHLSDIHFFQDNNSFFDKVDSFKAVIKRKLQHAEEIFLIISGDTAFSGKIEEFNYGLKLIEMIQGVLIDKEIKILIVPGNHDCDFTPSEIRDHLIKNSLEHLIEGNLRSQIIEPLKEYFLFENLFEVPHENVVFKDDLLKKYSFSTQGIEIHFNCLNSAWLSQLHEAPGQLNFPIKNYESALSSMGDLNISIIHHPSHWFHPNNKREVDNVLRKYSDIVITGHEHTQNEYQINDFENNQTLIFEGKALQTNDRNESNFSIIEIKVCDEVLIKHEYSWQDDLYKNITSKEIRFSLKRNSNSQFTIKDEFSGYLNDYGMPIKHPKTTIEVSFDELYVFPDVQKLELNEKIDFKRTNIINFKEILENPTSKKFILSAKEGYGKTSACKVAFKFAYDNGFIPVYIKGSDIEGPSLDRISKTVNKKFREQYNDNKSIDHFEQLNKEKLFIIIDDIDMAGNSEKYKDQLYFTLYKEFSNIMITGKDNFLINRYLKKRSSDEDIIYRYEHLELMNFGSRLRGEIIEKWTMVGNQYNVNDDELVRVFDHHEKTLNSIIGNNIVPSIPFFIVTILQTVESGETNLSESAYGYYYEHLIRQSLIGMRLKNEDIDAFNNYLSYLAYNLFKKGDVEFSEKEFMDFHLYFNDEFALSISFTDYCNQLIKANILSLKGRSFSFKYKYIYYFFVAKFFAQKIEEKDIKKQIVDICGKLYVEDFANIIMFLSHLSKSKIIIDSVYENATKILDQFSPANLNEDIKNLNAIVETVPKITIENQVDNMKNRKDHNIAKDSAKFELYAEDEDESSEAIDYDSFDVIANINLATKTIEILGQILRNYYGSTPAAEKHKLAKETYMLSMRALSTFLTAFNENQEFLIKEIEKLIEDKKLTDKKRQESAAKNFIFNLISEISRFFIDNVSHAIGTSKLNDTLSGVKKEIDTVAAELINISIKLEYDREIPFKDIEMLLHSVNTSSNLLARNILTKLSINHLRMFPADYKDKQKLINILEVKENVSRQLLVEHKA